MSKHEIKHFRKNRRLSGGRSLEEMLEGTDIDLNNNTLFKKQGEDGYLLVNNKDLVVDYIDTTSTKYKKILSYNDNMDNFIGINENITTLTINRCIKRIYEIQLLLLDQLTLTSITDSNNRQHGMYTTINQIS